LEASIEALKLESRRLAEQARSDALEIGILVARRILEREIASSIDPLFGLIRGAIRRLGEARNIVVRVSPHDHQRIFESQGAALSLATVTIQPDEALGPGDVMVDSDVHGADARLETRLEALRRELWASMQTEGS
jgi:flagellar assembly protein FliH